MSDFDGFLFDELSEFKKDLLRSVKEMYPKETDTFLKEEARKLRTGVKSKAKKLIGSSKKIRRYWNGKKSYHQSFKVGKIYIYSKTDKCIRTYSSNNVAHLLEYGHWNVPRSISRPTTKLARIEHKKSVQKSGYTAGRYPMLLAEIDFKTQFALDTNDFLYQFVDDTCNGKF